MQSKTSIAQAFSRKYPEQVAFVTTRGHDGKTNIMAVGAAVIVSNDPWMFLIGVDAEAHTCKLIRETGQFVVAYPSGGMTEAAWLVGTCHGDGRDKIAEAGLATQTAEQVFAPILADAVANFECKLVQIYQPGNSLLLVGEVVAAHENTDSRLTRLCIVGPNRALGGVTPKTGEKSNPPIITALTIEHSDKKQEHETPDGPHAAESQPKKD